MTHAWLLISCLLSRLHFRQFLLPSWQRSQSKAPLGWRSIWQPFGVSQVRPQPAQALHSSQQWVAPAAAPAADPNWGPASATDTATALLLRGPPAKGKHTGNTGRRLLQAPATTNPLSWTPPGFQSSVLPDGTLAQAFQSSNQRGICKRVLCATRMAKHLATNWRVPGAALASTSLA